MGNLLAIETQIKLFFYEKKGNEFENFIVSIYKILFPDLLAVKPQGQKGDGANDGYSSGNLIIQVYAPEIIDESLSIRKKEVEMIKKAIDKNKGKRKIAAKELGISERTLYRKIKEYDI